jgi:hypothetical protein
MLVVGSPNSSPDPTLSTSLQRHKVHAEECRRMENKTHLFARGAYFTSTGAGVQCKKFIIYLSENTEELDLGLAGWYREESLTNQPQPTNHADWL